MKEQVRFINKDRTQFFPVLKKRVDAYFKDNNIKSRHGDWRMVVKTFAMLALYIVPYLLIISNTFNPWIMLLLAIVMGMGIGGIGLSIMHDANHGGYSSKPKVNKGIGYTMNFVGGTAFTWILQHNVLHHTYTNIYEYDEDLDPQGTMRFSPEGKWKPIHRYQHFYAFFIYGLMSFFWVLHKDFLQLIRYNKMGLVKNYRANIYKEFAIMIVTKIGYYCYILAIPLLLVDISFWQWIIGFVAMHYTAGIILAAIFQAAHVVEEVKFPVPDNNNQIENEWAIHQLVTTANFARSNKALSWYCGGLNFQIEHHLFPNICHIHYRPISEIVKKTAEEFNLPYNDQPTFLKALRSHFRLLKKLGNEVPSVARAA